MTKILSVIIGLALLTLLAVTLAGLYKFNYLAAQPGYDVDGNRQKGQESLYFDPNDLTWKDDVGICHSCVIENGFGADGQIRDSQLHVTWQSLSLKLKNDLGENPPLSEVRTLFTTHYSADPQWFGIKLSQQGEIYHIIVATEGSHIDFLNPAGALKASYDVIFVE